MSDLYKAYSILGLEPGSPMEIIQRRYKRLIMVWHPYRFQNEEGKLGTNPEELIAAAHAACFNMQLAFMLAGAGFPADELNTEATVTIEQVGAGFAITNITLDLKGKVTGMSPEKFNEIAHAAKVACPVSNALRATDITLNITFNA